MPLSRAIHHGRHALRCFCVLWLCAFIPAAVAQVDTKVLALVSAEKEPFLATLKTVVEIESGSGDREGLDKLSQLIFDRLVALGGKVAFIEPTDVYKMLDTPPKIGRMVHAQFVGKGTSKIMLIAHMDTVYPRGMGAQQPFKIDGKRAYGLGISDDKQGVAAILHIVSMLKALKFDDYGLLTVLINGDEEISSPGSRSTLTRMGAEHDAVMSFEASTVNSDALSLTTAGIAGASLNVKGRASHAGSAPERGRNALYELAHQILQMRDLSSRPNGTKVNWTVAHAGNSRNVIPAEADAMADVRVLRVADYDGVEALMRERIKTKLIPDTEVELIFERRRPPLEATPASRQFAAHAQKVYAEIGKKLVVSEEAAGGGTDAAFAALKATGAVVERFGIAGFGAHSSNAEYIDIDSIEPRLYLAVRMIIDFSLGRVTTQ
jgi:glutamate carboxypeptidase